MNYSEGYSCALRVGSWVIIDRFGAAQPSQPSFETHGPARDFADQLNAGVIARRLGKTPVAAVVRATKAAVKVRTVSKPVPAPKMSFDAALAALDLF